MANAVLIIHDVRSTHNVGSMLRTADGLGVKKVFFSGYTPYPAAKDDERLPHIQRKINNQISKTALGAEKNVSWQKVSDVKILINSLRQDGYDIIALEQTDKAILLNNYKPKKPVALIVGNEVEGISKEILGLTDSHIQIPMSGKKESFNVAVACGIALFWVINNRT